jgi:hypothetical protein
MRERLLRLDAKANIRVRILDFFECGHIAGQDIRQKPMRLIF